MASTFTNLLYHAVFSTKDRMPTIHEGLRERLYEYIGGIIRKRTANPIFPPPGWIFENTRQEVIHGAEAES